MALLHCYVPWQLAWLNRSRTHAPRSTPLFSRSSRSRQTGETGSYDVLASAAAPLVVDACVHRNARHLTDRSRSPLNQNTGRLVTCMHAPSSSSGANRAWIRTAKDAAFVPGPARCCCCCLRSDARRTNHKRAPETRDGSIHASDGCTGLWMHAIAA